MSAPRVFRIAHDLPGGIDQVHFDQRLADVETFRGDEGVGDATADDQLVDLADQRRQQFQLGADLAAGDDRQQRPRRVVERLAECVEFGHQQRAAAGGPGEPDHAMGGRLARCAVPNASMTNTSHSAAYRFDRGSSSVFSPTFMRQFFQQHQLARLHVDAVEVIAQQRHLTAEQFRETLRHRRQRIGLAPRAFLRPAEVRRHHHRRTLVQRALQCRQCGGDALLRGDAAVAAAIERDGNVQVLADQHPLACEVEVGHAEDGHGGGPCFGFGNAKPRRGGAPGQTD
jgi:hypothetical protein